MNGWRVAFGLGLLVFVAAPLLVPFGGLLEPAAWIWTADDAYRLFHLSLNTFILSAATAALSLPLGLCFASLLFRTSFFARRCVLFLLALALFVPLPVLVSSWQGLLGADGLGFWRGSAARPWATGMGAAIWIHAFAAVPWVAFIVGLGLTWVEPELEDEAAQSVGAWRVLAVVTLPRARASVLAAALFVVLQTAGEVSVTEMMLVPTLAEEMRLQFASADAALGRTLVVTLPSLLVAWAMVLAVLTYLEKTLPPLVMPYRGQRPLNLGPGWLRLVGATVLIVALLLPLCSLGWKLGVTGHPGRWDAGTAWHFLRAGTRLLGGELVASLATSIVTGLAVAWLAVICCWLACERAWFRWPLFGVVTWVWVVPGPAVGIGLHKLFFLLPEGPWKTALWYGPSPAPLMWAQALRALPIAVVFLWPVVRLIPRELFEEARLGGAGAMSEFLHVVAPMTARAALVTGAASAALCLGEIGASERVSTPGWESFAGTLLKQMHTGVDNSVSALCVMMLTSLVVLALAVAGLWKLIRVFSYR
jgi:iron(III) transport system permease protein